MTRLAAAIFLAVGFLVALGGHPRDMRSAAPATASSPVDACVLAGRRVQEEPTPPATTAPAQSTESATVVEYGVPEDPPPPDVYGQSTDQRVTGATPTLRIRIVRSWEEVPYREIGGSQFTAPWNQAAWWSLSEIRDEAEVARGSFDRSGYGEVHENVVSRWTRGGYRLSVSAPRFKTTVISQPADLGDLVTVYLEPDAPVLHWRGRVVDQRGRPRAGAGVFAVYPEGAGVHADSDGRFDVAIPTWSEDAVLLAAVAPGFEALQLRGRPGGEDGMEFALVPDVVHGRLEVRILRQDGTPASRARVWLYAEGKSWQKRLGWGRWDGGEDSPCVDESGIVDDDDSTTRKLLARLEGSQAIDDQGFELAQDYGPLLKDLVTGEDGQLLIPAILPGTYHLRAALAQLASGSCIVDPPECYSFQVEQTLDTSVTVEPPPSVTSLELRLQSGRSVTGRIQVAANPTWHCDHREHRHWIRVDDWAWAQVSVRSGVSERDGETELTGRFRFDGLPRCPCTLRIQTSYHPDVVIKLPALDESKTAAFDLGTIEVPDARAMPVWLRMADGSKSTWDGAVEIRGVPDALPKRWVGGDVTLLLPTRPAPTANIVLFAMDRDDPVAILHAPFDFAKDRPVVITVPSLEPARAAQENK